MMRRLFLFALVLLAAPAAHAQIDIRINLPLPTIRFQAPPPLVVVQPGVQVVEDADDEVFYVDNWYWVRRENVWYRARDHRGGWVVVSDVRRVPTRIVSLPPGQYRHYRGRPVRVERVEKVKVIKVEEREHDRGHGGGHGNGHGRGHGRW